MRLFWVKKVDNLMARQMWKCHPSWKKVVRATANAIIVVALMQTVPVVTSLVMFSSSTSCHNSFTARKISAAKSTPSGYSRSSDLHLDATSSSSSPTTSNDVVIPPLRRTKPRKIALFIEPTPFTHVSGYANRFKELLRFLSKAGDNVEIVTTEIESKVKQQSNTKKAILPTNIFGFQIHHTLGFSFPLYNHIALTLDLPDMLGAKVLERLRPDLIHATSPGLFCLAAIFYARMMRIPLLLSYHTHLPIYGRNYLGFIPGIEEICWMIIRFFHSYADLTLVTSPQMRDEFVANGVPRVDVWRKGIDTYRFSPKYRCDEMRQKMTDGNPTDFLLVYIGRLGTEKRLKDLKQVLQKMPPNTRLCLVGTGPQEAELKEYFRGTNTVFTGQLHGDDLSKAFASADVFLMPSDSETLGFVVLESMASGVPVIGANAGGIPSLIHDGDTSFLVPPGDIDAFVQKLILLQTNPTFRVAMGAKARKEAEQWSWESATSVLRNIQYEIALLNFHSRAFGGFRRQSTLPLWRSFFKKLWARLRNPSSASIKGKGGDVVI